MLMEVKRTSRKRHRFEELLLPVFYNIARAQGLRAESARAVTGRRCPHSEEGEDFLTGQPDFFYENCCNSGTESRKIDPKVGNEPSL